MSDVILKVENLSKQYRLGTISSGTISHDLNRWWASVRGKEDPYLKIGETNDRSSKGESEYVWALKDINFEVKKGEVLGIIGKNGAGKSTLLKILSKVTSPTTGSIKSKGRIASLLEVGTGFHPEMTGKENIYLNGAILGMTKKEIAQKFDEIVEFSGCERYIDTPVKRYSSGMKVRLAFAVAAFLEPDILVVDEVLAVGDAEFQKKAIGKMQDISQGEGRTVLFVSHDMVAVNALCEKTLVIDNGEIVLYENVKKGIDFYLQNSLSNNNELSKICFDIEKHRQISYVCIVDNKQQIRNQFRMGEPLFFKFGILNRSFSKDMRIAVLISDSRGRFISSVGTLETSKKTFDVASENVIFDLEITDVNLMPDKYFISVLLAVEGKIIDKRENCLTFQVLEKDIFGTGKIPPNDFCVFFRANWNCNSN